ncbi:YjzC family protein [bacterium]|nr:YjzC family protein [bacterium]
MAKQEKLKPGQEAPRSGQYGVVGPRGGDTGKEVTVPKGKVLPPTSKPGQGYKLNDPTKNKSGQGK